MVQQFPHSKHFLTYKHSLRVILKTFILFCSLMSHWSQCSDIYLFFLQSYASILYLRLPIQFQIYLRGFEVKHHNMINDMMLIKEMIYRPQIQLQNCMVRQVYSNVTIGFIKDAYHHIDIQGFNVYHKNRLIKVSINTENRMCWL